VATRPPIALLTLAALGLAVGAAALAAPGDVTRVSLSDAGLGGDQQAQGAAASADGRYVAFTSTAKLTAADSGGRRQLYVRDRATGRTILASSSAAGVPANLDVDEDHQNVPYALSGDGRYAVFASTATDLVVPDANGPKKDVFRKDLATGAIVLVDVNGQSEQANDGVSGDPDVSGDGSRVAYVSGTATNLFPGDGNNAMDVVVRDLSANTSVLVSQSTQGAQANNFTERPAISADGRFVSFDGGALTTNLVPGQQPGEVLVRDLAAGTTTRATVTTAGATPGGANFSDISGDGRYVVFQTTTAYDPANDTNTGFDVYRRDLATGTTTLVTAKDGSTQSGATQGGILPAISADGTRVLFESDATDLLPGGADANAVTDAFVRDVATARTTRVSTKAGGAEAPSLSARAGLSANGGLAAFDNTENPGQGLVPGDTNGKEDVFARELVPTDGTAPGIAIAAPAEGASGADQQVVVSGTVGPDPSGIVGASLNGAPLALGAGGAFSATVSLAVGPTALIVVATDGAGNTAAASRTVTRAPPAAAVPPPTALRVRPTNLRYALRKRRLIVNFRLPAAARVRVQLLRVTPRPKTKPVRYRYTGVGRAVARNLGPGNRRVTLVIPLLKPGRYQLRVSTVAAGGLAQAVRTIIVKKKPTKAARAPARR
jgi:Tol biopolymer transport system component